MGIIAELFGYVVGGIIWGYLFGRLFGRLFFREEEPDSKALKAAICAFAASYLMAGWGFANGAGLNFVVGFLYAPGVFLAYFLLRKDYRKRWILEGDTFE